jgi:hypothetical protein
LIKLCPKTGKLKTLYGDKIGPGKPVYYGFKKNNMIVGYIQEFTELGIACSFGNIDFKSEAKLKAHA